MTKLKMWWSFVKDFREKFMADESVANVLLNQILIFPLVVVLAVALTLLCGSRCAIWQWWMAVAIVLAVPYLCCRWKKASVAGAWFLVFMFAFWVVTGISVTKSGTDCQLYHYPVIRMLMLGWNPVWESTREAILSFSGGEERCSTWYVLSMARPVWYFSAVASFFTRNQFDFYHPVVVICFCSVACCVWKLLARDNLLIKLVAVVFMASCFQVYEVAQDMVMSLSAVGLLSCLYAYLKDRIWRPLPMVCFSFWMCSAKHTGALFCAIMWLSFAAVVLILERREWKPVFFRFLRMAGVIGGLFLVANVSPFITNFVHYSHPLYPQCTFNEEKFPAVDLTTDFKKINEDAGSMMNRPAMFVNAFISPDLVRGYYAWKLDKPDFRPWGRPWKHSGGTDGWDTPMRAEYRLWIVIPIALMILLGGLAERFVAVVMLLCALALPAEMVGYLRYVAMIRFSFVFCLPVVWELLARRRAARIVLAIALVGIGCLKLFEVVDTEIRLIDQRLEIFECFERGLPKSLYYTPMGDGCRRYRLALDSMKLLVPQMKNASIQQIPKTDTWGIVANVNKQFPIFPDSSFRVPQWYAPYLRSPSSSIVKHPPKSKDGWSKVCLEFLNVLRCFAVEVPRAILLRVSGKIDNHMIDSEDRMLPVTHDAMIESCVNASAAVLGRWGMTITNGRISGGEEIQGESNMKLSYPGWMKRNNVRGVLVEGRDGSGACKMKFSADGEAVIELAHPRTVDDSGTKLPFYADYDSLMIDGREMLAGRVPAADIKRHSVRVQVRKGETLDISVRVSPHRYPKEELRQLLLSAAKLTTVTEDSIDEVLADKKLAQYIEMSPDEKTRSKENE